MKIKNQVFTLLATTLIASTPMLDASISGVTRETEINGDIVITVAQTTQGQIIGQVSADGGLNWSQPTLLNPGEPSGNLPVVAAGANSAACAYLTPPQFSSIFAILVGGAVTGQSGAWGTTVVSEQDSCSTPQGLDFAGSGNNVILLLNPSTDSDTLSLCNFPPPIPNPHSSELDISVSKLSDTSIMPVLLAANGLTALLIAPQPSNDNLIFQLSQLCYSGQLPEDIWVTAGPPAYMTVFNQSNPLLNPSSQMQLATSKGISQASLVWLEASQLHTSQLNPITNQFWSDPFPLDLTDTLTSMGGLNFNEALNTLQVLVRNNHGDLLYAFGTADAITIAIPLKSLPINQISKSQINGATGLWLVLDNNNTLSLWQASPQGLTSMTIAKNLSSVQDHNTSLSIASNASPGVTGVVLLVFDTTSSSAKFPGHPGLNGPGTYVFRSEGYPLNFTAQRIAN